MNREEFAKRLSSVVVPEGTSAEEMKKITAPISEAISRYDLETLEDGVNRVLQRGHMRMNGGNQVFV